MDLRAILNSPDDVLKNTTRRVTIPARPKTEQNSLQTSPSPYAPSSYGRWPISLQGDIGLVVNYNLSHATSVAHDSSVRPTSQHLRSTVSGLFPHLQSPLENMIRRSTRFNRVVSSVSPDPDPHAGSLHHSVQSTPPNPLSVHHAAANMPHVARSRSPEHNSDAESTLSSERSLDNSAPQRCNFVEGCILESEDRKVISHFFGRNKMCTRLLPNDVFETYCRKHYQRARYRSPENFAQKQMELVRFTVENIRDWGGASEFEFTLRKRARELIEAQDAHAAAYKAAADDGRTLPSMPLGLQKTSKERWLTPYVGKYESAEGIFPIIDKLQDYVLANHCNPPEFEILVAIKDKSAKADKSSKKPVQSKRQQRTPVKSTTPKRRSTLPQVASARSAKKAARRISNRSTSARPSQISTKSHSRRRSLA